MFVFARSIFTSSPAPSRLPVTGRLARAARSIGAWPLCFALLATIFAPSAQAQTTRQTVVVLDFEVAATIDPIWGRKAADAVAVELQRSGDYEVVTRQRVDEVRLQQAGLGDPFSQITQSRLGLALGASDVFSGRVLAVETTPTRASRVRLDVRQLETTNGDYVEGAQTNEIAEQPVIEVANEILADEALNKAAYAAVRQLGLPNTRVGTVLNTTRDDVELSIGSRSGVLLGQIYAVLRDIYNPAKRITERRKIGELVIQGVDANGSVATLSQGGQVGIRTGDRVRQIYVVTFAIPLRDSFRNRRGFNSRGDSTSNGSSSTKRSRSF